MKKIILTGIAVILIAPCIARCDTGGAAKKLKLIKLTEDAITEDSYKPIAGKEKLLAVKVVDKEGRGVFGAEVKFSILQKKSGFIVISTAEISVSEIKIRTNIIGEAIVFLKIPNSKAISLKPRAILTANPNQTVDWNFEVVDAPNKLEKNFWHKAVRDNENKMQTYKANLEINSNEPGQPARRTIKLERKAGRKLKVIPDKGKNYETAAESFWYPPFYDTEPIAYNRKTKTAVMRHMSKGSGMYPYRLIYVDFPGGNIIKEERYRYFQNGLVHKFETEYNDLEDKQIKGHRYNTKVTKANSGLTKEKFRTTAKITDWRNE